VTDVYVDAHGEVSLTASVTVERWRPVRWSRLSGPTREQLRRFVGPFLMLMWLVFSIATTHHQVASIKSDSVMCRKP